MCTLLYNELHKARGREIGKRAHREVRPGEIGSAGSGIICAGNTKAEKKFILLTLFSRLSIAVTSESCQLE